MNKPILVLQMQRMGDLIMSFPLLALLQKCYRGHPIWTVAEECFFNELMPFTPSTTYFPPSAIHKLQKVQFHTIINLSHRPEAAAIAGSLKAEHYMGPHIRKNATYITGAWSLYRASIVENNRYNLFHWADLHLLDHISGAKLPPVSTSNILRTSAKAVTSHKKVGIFVGASEVEKRPTAAFFATLAKELLRKDCQPIFLGGPNDIALGKEAMHLSGIKGSSLCGAFSLGKLAAMMATLDLCITPDTGPMHLAAWTNTPVLNISIGPVNPWETGPMNQGQYVITPKLSCTGCWKACQTIQRCQNRLHPKQVAMLTHTLLHRPKDIHKLQLRDIHLYTTGRDANGLYTLLPIQENIGSARMALARFWQEWFWHTLHPNAESSLPRAAVHILEKNHPALFGHLFKATHHITAYLTKHIIQMRKGHNKELPFNFWQAQPMPIRPLSGHMHLYLQNEEYSQTAFMQCLQNIEILANLCQKI